MHTTPVKHKYALGDRVWVMRWASHTSLRRVAGGACVDALLPRVDTRGQSCDYEVCPSAGHDPIPEDELFETCELAQAACDKWNKEAGPDEATD